MIGFYYPDGKENFEYDVRGLLTSFFPGEEIRKIPGAMTEEEGRAAGFRVVYAVPEPDFTRPYEDIKNAFKRRVYDELRGICGTGLPWGTLTGIRPTKLIMQMLEEGRRPAEIAERMRRAYREASVGEILPVLFESAEDGSLGHSDTYLPVRVDEPGLRGELRNVRVLAAERDFMRGEIV